MAKIVYRTPTATDSSWPISAILANLIQVDFGQ
jgi:hypothetical protein